MRVFDRGVTKQAKRCATCGRVFTWRKKWKNCWGQVKYCSKKCKSTFQQLQGLQQS